MTVSQAVAQAPAISNFARHMLEFLDRVEYRRVIHAEDLEEIGRLRYRSYMTRNVMDDNLLGTIIDEVDHDHQAYVYGMYIDGMLVSTLRVHHITADHRIGTSANLFPDILGPMLDDNMSFVDPTRFAAEPVYLSEFPAIPYLTLRIAAMASEHFDANFCLAAVKPEHMAFYKRIFGSKMLADPRDHEGYGIQVGLGAAAVSSIRDAVAVRFPFFKSQPHERRNMFADTRLGNIPLTIMPTAKYTGLGA
ncbi:N-acyl amino acid synthase FeeM domain-containing protein [Pseudochrobactrum sp. MP213Fo]|uniref:N-acyl amino acid synthase FeeM domain-containing protein n=1 Tax=Pseudochrobactrum sp. MP213Fo TaxID=3022250 RepID=UPI003BA269B8